MTSIQSEQIKGKLTRWVDNDLINAIDTLEEDDKSKHIPMLPNKPIGVWISWDNGWEEWCNNNGEHTSEWVNPKTHTCYDITLKKGLKLWLIDSHQDFLKVWHNYDPSTQGNMMIMSDKKKLSDFWLWLEGQGYDGIALTEKGQWETRMTTFLYGWDCQCILIFEKDNITMEETKWRLE